MESITVLDLIKLALQQIKYLGTGDVLSDEDAQIAKTLLNLMLGSWSIDTSYIYVDTLHQFNFIPNQANYTIGPGGDVNLTDRPLKIVSAYTQQSGISYPMKILTSPGQYDGIINKGITSSFPTTVWYEQTAPLGTLWFWPKPVSGQANVRFNSPLSQILNLTDVMTFPLGYAQAMMYGLAMEVAGPFGMRVPNSVSVSSAQSKIRLRKYNLRKYNMSCETALISKRGGAGRYNINGDS